MCAAYGNLGHILSTQGKAAEAEWAYRRALAYRHNMADVHYNLGNLLQEEGRLEEALQCYLAAVSFRPRLSMAYLNMGVVLGSLGRRTDAIEALRKCAGLDGSGLKDPRLHESTRISALLHLGRSLAEEERYQEAIEVYLAAVKRLPDHYKQPQALYNMLAVHRRRVLVPGVSRAKPDHVPALLTYAKLLSKWDKPSEAEQRFLTARSLAPNDSEVYHHYGSMTGQFLAEQARVGEAADLYVRAAQLAPDHYEVILMAASTLREAGRNLEAERYYHMAARLRPQEVSSHLNLGAMLHLNGKLQEAEASYLEALRLRPGDPTTLDNLHKLRRSVRNRR
ncbi:TMTC2 [Cordylochernes scorpioides]|uniref:TMTC2 n=1 Tax=Cordylochernes scorpioides TaxID=51811 RepID=A0ABY6KG66_9ARAC|nr:TMTC2 [Cordylochernes scorpioides]